MKAGGERRFLEPILLRIGDKPLDAITQATVNALAVDIYPDATPATRNRQVYTPVAAILAASGARLALARPKGWRGKPRTFFLTPEQAFALFDAAHELQPRFAGLLIFLTYCGPRLSEALRLIWDDVDLDAGTARLRETKNGEPQTAYLPPAAVAALRSLPRLSERGRPLQSVFGFSKAGRLYQLLDRACEAAGVVIPDRVAFHAFRHTYGAWMRRYGDADTSIMVAAGRWKDAASARVYEHVDASDAARRADRFPTRAKSGRPALVAKK
jgi:integrase